MTMLKLHWNRNIWIGKGKMLNCIPWEILFCALHWTTFSSLFVCSLRFTATSLSNTNKLWTKTFLLKISPSARVWPPPPQNQLRPPKCCDNTMFFKLHFLVISHLQTFLFKGQIERKKYLREKAKRSLSNCWIMISCQLLIVFSFIWGHLLASPDIFSFQRL